MSTAINAAQTIKHTTNDPIKTGLCHGAKTWLTFSLKRRITHSPKGIKKKTTAKAIIAACIFLSPSISIH